MKPTDIDQQQKIAIVLATGINGLSAVRSLNTVNFQVIAITSTDKDLSASSNLPHKLYIVKDDKNWKKNMLSLLDKLNFKDLPPIIACSDKSADFLASNSNRLSLKYSLLTPSKNVTKILNDKSLEINRISSINIPMPRSLPDISKGVALGKLIELKLPVIIKPRSFKYCELINAKNIIINNETEWDKFYLKYYSNLNKLIAQEIIPGNDGNLWVCNVTFNKQSKLIAAFSFQRLGTMPSHYGVTSMAISKLNYRVIELSEKIGSALNYVGPAMFEFKYDKTSNEYLYIETNPRLGMCNWFDTCCGINNVEYIGGYCLTLRKS